MSPRADDTPRRGTQPRRGTSRDLPVEGAEESAPDRGFGGIGDARAYTPRGRTMAERDQRTRSPRAGRTTDPFRPALQVLDGGQPPRRGRGRTAEEPAQPEPETPAPRRTARRDADRELGRESRRETTRGRRPEPDHDDEDDVPQRRPRTAARTGAAPKAPTTSKAGAATKAGQAAKAGPAPRGGTAARSGTAAKSGTGASGGSAGRTRLPDRDETKSNDRSGRLRVAASSSRGSTASASPRTGRDAGTRRTVTGPRVSRSVRAVAAEPPKLANSARRLRLGTVMALSLFMIIGVRLVVLQVASSPGDAAKLIELRKDRLSQVDLPAARGSILDRDGTVLAHSVEARFIGADPTWIKDPVQISATLSPLLGIAQSKLLPLMKPHNRPGGGESHFEFLAQGVDISLGDRIKAMKLKGIVVGQDERRDLPGANLASNLIGFTGTSNNGLAGLESRYDSLLRGTKGERVFEIGNGDLNKPIPGGYERYTPPNPGSSVQLTIDSNLQYEVQRILVEQMDKVKASIAGAVVMDVKTGEVVAQASYPTFNAAKPEDYPSADRGDVPSSIIADPGSVHKAFIFGAALEEGLIKPDSVQEVGPAIERGGYRFQDSHIQPKGTKMTIPGLLAYSSNVGTILTADKLGKQKVYEYQQKFGLGRSTDEGMPAEAPGKILTPDEWSPSASGSVPIGMSVDATLVQMTAGYNAIANDGMYVQPHLIKATISGKDGRTTAAAAPETHRVLSAKVAGELRTMMEAVVDNKHGTGVLAAVTGYRVAGKTGTGKRLIDGRYTSYNYGSFIGMAPAENPRFVIAVSADVPKGTGGDVAAPAFSEMMSFALLQYRVPPSTTKAPELKIYP
ncbi:penicillin-binding transpeptidase domain-containing protein [Micromonosporaceae bacterium Da 78-11]